MHGENCPCAGFEPAVFLKEDLIEGVFLSCGRALNRQTKPQVRILREDNISQFLIYGAVVLF